MRNLVALAGLISALGLASTSLAQDEEDPGPTAQDEEARSLFEAGRLALEGGRFEEAFGHFSRAYELSPRPALLFNMGVTADRLHRYDEALDAFRRYLATGQAHNEADVQARIVILERSVAEGAAEPAPAPAVAEGGGGPNILWTFVLGGAAVATWGLTIGFFVAANDAYAGLEQRCGATGCSDTEIADSGIDTFAILTNVFLVTSLVFTAGAGTALALEIALGGSGGDADAEARLRIGPTGLALEGSF